ncbi:MAG: AMP-binding protein, partial [bacterium]|nr:AMP-binding protein [bacterium]
MVNVRKIVNTRVNALTNSKMDLEAIYNVMFMEKKYIFAESNNGYKITKHTYSDVDKKIKDVAYSINQKYPDLKDTYIGISIDTSIEWIYVFWGIILSNNKPFLINLRHPKELTNAIIDDLEIKYVIGSNLGYNATLINLNELDLEHPTDYKFIFSNELCLSTSATTLKRKVVFFTGLELSNQILNVKYVLQNNKEVKKHYKNSLKQLVFLPLYHIFGLIAVYVWFCFFGRTLVFLKDYSSNTILNTIKMHKVTHIFAVPLFWQSIEKEILKEVSKKSEKTQKKFYDGMNKTLKLQQKFPSLGLKLSKKGMKEITDKLFGRQVVFTITGGSYIKDSTLRLINALGYPLYNGYGMSEIGITSVELGGITDRLKNSIGKPMPSVEYKIIDDILYVKGKSISHKIMVNKEITVIDEYYKTNDIVKVDEDGRYYILGRLDDLYISNNGENVSPDEIEKLLNIENINNYSVLDIKGNLSLVIEIKKYLTNSQKEAINNSVIENVNKLDNSFKPTKIYYAFDPLMSEVQIKVSRK